MRRIGAAASLQPHHGQEFFNALVDFFLRATRNLQRVCNVFCRRARIEQVGCLKHHAEVPASLTQFRSAQLSHVNVVDHDFTTGWAFEGGQTADQCGFSGPRLTHDSVNRARIDVQRHVIKCDNVIPAAQVIHLAYVVKVNHGSSIGPGGSTLSVTGGCCSVIEPGLLAALDGRSLL